MHFFKIISQWLWKLEKKGKEWGVQGGEKMPYPPLVFLGCRGSIWCVKGAKHLPPKAKFDSSSKNFIQVGAQRLFWEKDPLLPAPQWGGGFLLSQCAPVKNQINSEAKHFLKSDHFFFCWDQRETLGRERGKKRQNLGLHVVLFSRSKGNNEGGGKYF